MTCSSCMHPVKTNLNRNLNSFVLIDTVQLKDTYKNKLQIHPIHNKFQGTTCTSKGRSKINVHMRSKATK